MKQVVSNLFVVVCTGFSLSCGGAGGGEEVSGGGNNNGGSPLDGINSTQASGASATNPDGSPNVSFAGDVSGVDNPCEQEDAPEACELVPSGPACGDGELNQEGEACDDGNSLPGDGCSGVCVVEAYHECPVAGEPCVSTIICGDGVLGPGEACDDANNAGGDGCAEDCTLVETGYSCREVGQACIRVYLCGDGSVDPSEGCDDGGNADGDGCDAKCRLELGFKCEGSPSSCSPTECGDEITEGAESCDDGNTLPFDGCAANCRAEPECDGACAARCGDGIVLGEDCDDGNLRDGDGCSSNCTVEEGYTCDNDAGACVLVGDVCTFEVPVVYRDFVSAHSDFEPGYNNEWSTIEGVIDDRLDADGKPVYVGNGTRYTDEALTMTEASDGGIASVASFEEWYRDSNNSVTIVDTIVLWDNLAGGFVNRWGENGEQWEGYEIDENGAPVAVWCEAGSDCTNCNPGEFTDCLDPCTVWDGSADACGTNIVYYDGDPVFFPIDDAPGIQDDMRYYAVIPPAYGMNWEQEPGGDLHNFHFTSEVRYWFEYDPALEATLSFTGDDDVWVFVNGRLALDIGGWHPPLTGEVVLDAATGTALGLETGSVYEIAIFHAERKSVGSSFKLTLSDFNIAPSDCTTDCGDGEIAPGEECDDGPLNQGGYNQCTPDCTLGPRCGDSIVQDEFGEICDDGVNAGAYGGCAPTCQLGPHCGDGVVQADSGEQCDDGVNDGGYGECSAGCVLGPFCGDGNLSVEFEECDDGNNESRDGCSNACKTEVILQ